MTFCFARDETLNMCTKHPMQFRKDLKVLGHMVIQWEVSLNTPKPFLGAFQ